MATARPDTWMPIYWGDYAKDTGHLSAAHHGAYLMLIKHYWVSGYPLPDDDELLWRIGCADSIQHWRKMRPVIEQFFRVESGQWQHARVEQELEKAGANAARRAASASRASRIRWNRGGGDEGPGGNAPRNPPRNPPRNASRMPNGMRQPSPPPYESVTTTSPVAQSARASGTDAQRMRDEDWEPEAEGVGQRPAKPVAFHAQPVAQDWQPSDEARRNLEKSRPDLTPERIDERTAEFRRWCAETNKHTHNPDATWLNFMVKTHAERPNDHRKGDVADTVAAFAKAGSR